MLVVRLGPGEDAKEKVREEIEQFGDFDDWRRIVDINVASSGLSPAFRMIQYGEADVMVSGFSSCHASRLSKGGKQSEDSLRARFPNHPRTFASTAGHG